MFELEATYVFEGEGYSKQYPHYKWFTRTYLNASLDTDAYEIRTDHYDAPVSGGISLANNLTTTEHLIYKGKYIVNPKDFRPFVMSYMRSISTKYPWVLPLMDILN